MTGLSIGVLFFFYTVRRFGGFHVVFSHLFQVRYFYFLVGLNSLAWMLLYTEGWYQLFAGMRDKFHFFSLLKVKISGEGVNFMTPLGFIAGDPIRVLLLKKLIGPDARLRSVVIDRLMHSFSAQFFCLMGMLLVFYQQINFPFWLHILILGTYVFLCVFFTFMLWSMITGRGLDWFSFFFRLLNIPKRLPGVADMLFELRDDLAYYRDRPKHPFVISFFLHFLGRVLGAVEIMIILYALGGGMHFGFAVIMASLTSFFGIVFGFIPGALGVLEKLYAEFFLLYGLGPDMGVSVQLVRRVRILFWIFVGILILDYVEISDFFKKIGRKQKMAKDS